MGVQYLRGVAAISILVYHVVELTGRRLNELATFGVPLFFVISGFIMVAITNDETKPLAFMMRRIVRIGPLYWLMTIAVLLVWPQEFHGYRNLAASFVFLPFPYDGSDPKILPPLAVGWTLNLEMLFYILFALTLLAPSRNRPLLLTVMLATMVAIGQALPAPSEIAFWGQPLVLLFAVGSWMGRWWTRGGQPSLPVMVLTILFIASMFYLLRSWERDVVSDVMSFIAVVAMIATLIIQRRGFFRTANRPLGLIGDASYAIYLSHPIVLFAALRLLGTSQFSPGTALALIAASIAVGIALYLTVERPLLHRVREMLGLRLPVLAQAW